MVLDPRSQSAFNGCSTEMQNFGKWIIEAVQQLGPLPVALGFAEADFMRLKCLPFDE